MKTIHKIRIICAQELLKKFINPSNRDKHMPFKTRTTKRKEKRSIFVLNIKNGKPQKKVLISGAIHGNESIGRDFCLAFTKKISKSSNPLFMNTEFSIIPLVNVYGEKKNSRYSHRVDINRDFFKERRKETSALRKYIDEYLPDWVIDLHESNTNKVCVLYNRNMKMHDVLIGFFDHIKDDFLTENHKQIYLFHDMSKHSCDRISRGIYKIRNIGSLIDYCEKLKLPGLILELPSKNNKNRELKKIEKVKLASKLIINILKRIHEYEKSSSHLS